MAKADAGCQRAYEELTDLIPSGLAAKARWLQWRPYLIAGGVAAALLLLAVVFQIGSGIMSERSRGSFVKQNKAFLMFK